MKTNNNQSLEVKGISKRFPGVQALDNVDFCVKGGEVHAIVGENGAGKSTLIKILMGVYQMDSGCIYLDGELVHIHNPLDARHLGLIAVYQDVVIAPELTVGENFFTGKLPTNRLGIVNWGKVYSESAKTLRELGIDVDPKSVISTMMPGEQAMVTIAKIIRDEARFVIFDEPTARLTNEETDKLFELIARLKRENIGIIYISHRLEEIFEICDTVTVLRDGLLMGANPVSEVNEDTLISMMVGRNIQEMYSIERVKPGEVVLEAQGISQEDSYRDVSFKLRQGEVLGLFGLVGSGRTSLLRTLFGAETYDMGRLVVRGEQVRFKSPAQAMNYGIALVPEDRKLEGLAMPLSVKVNINIASYDLISRFGFISGRNEKQRSNEMVSELNIRTPSLDQVLVNLSGGNQQKVAIAKWLCKNAEILLLDEPTTGVDVGAKVEIYRLVEVLIRQGKAIIICSSYLPEVMGLSDRILVMSEGEITGEVPSSEADEELLLRMASKIPVDITLQ